MPSGNDEYHVTLHNTGADGNMVIKLTNQGNEWNETLFFSRNERRTVVIKLGKRLHGDFNFNVHGDGFL